MKLKLVLFLSLLVILSLAKFKNSNKKVNTKKEKPVTESLFSSRFYSSSCYTITTQEDCTLRKMAVKGLWGEVEECAWCLDTICEPSSGIFALQNLDCITFPSPKDLFLNELALKKSHPDVSSIPVEKHSPGVLMLLYDFKNQNLHQMPMLTIPPHFAYKSPVVNFNRDYDPVQLENDFATRVVGFFEAKVTGEYYFCLKSDDGSMLYMKEEISENLYFDDMTSLPVVDNSGRHKLEMKCDDDFGITLGKGKHPFMIKHFQDEHYYHLTLLYKGPGTGNDHILVGPELLSSPSFAEYQKLHEGVNVQVIEKTKAHDALKPSYVYGLLPGNSVITKSLSLNDKNLFPEKNAKSAKRIPFFLRSNFYVDLNAEHSPNTYKFCLEVIGKAYLFKNMYSEALLSVNNNAGDKTTKKKVCERFSFRHGYQKFTLISLHELGPYEVELTWSPNPAADDVSLTSCKNCVPIPEINYLSAESRKYNTVAVEVLESKGGSYEPDMIPIYSTNDILPAKLGAYPVKPTELYKVNGFLPLKKGPHTICSKTAPLTIINDKSIEVVDPKCSKVTLIRDKDVQFKVESKTPETVEITTDGKAPTSYWSYEDGMRTGVIAEYFISQEDFSKKIDLSKREHNSIRRLNNIDTIDYYFPGLETSNHHAVIITGIAHLAPNQGGFCLLYDVDIHKSYLRVELYVGKETKPLFEYEKLRGTNPQHEKLCTPSLKQKDHRISANLKPYMIVSGGVPFKLVYYFSSRVTTTTKGITLGYTNEKTQEFVTLTPGSFNSPNSYSNE